MKWPCTCDSRQDRLSLRLARDTSIAQHPVSAPAAEWVIEHDQIAGPGTNTLPNAAALFLPLTGSQQILGALAVRTSDMERLLEPDQRQLLEACANQLALALERDQLAIDAAEARIQAESEQVRSALLSSVSHDLRTPLAAIAGVSSSLLEATNLDDTTRRQLLETLADEATRLCRLLENILQMSRLDAGNVTPNKQWHVLGRRSLVPLSSGRIASWNVIRLNVRMPGDLPLVFVDGLLLEQVLVNLLENAARYTPAETSTQRGCVDRCRLAATDRGRQRTRAPFGSRRADLREVLSWLARQRCWPRKWLGTGDLPGHCQSARRNHYGRESTQRAEPNSCCDCRSRRMHRRSCVQ